MHLVRENHCTFFLTVYGDAMNVSFLGHTLSKEEMLLDPENVTKILNWPVPKMVHEVRVILGLGSYYCCFIGILATG